MMKVKGMVSTLLLSMAFAACSTAGSNTATTENKYSKQTYAKAEVNPDEPYYAVLEFEKGTQRLSESSKRDLRDFVASAKKDGREIDDIKILAWADKEYPAEKGAKLADRDVKIANERTKSIERYLKDDLKTDGNYATYNMAKKPNKVSEFFRGDDYKTKRIFEKQGSAPAGTSMSSFMTSKASKALIMVDYERE